jgi:hypothetical protein
MNLQDLLNEIKRLTGFEAGSFLLFVSSMCPGIIAIWLFDPDLLKNSGASKLVLLALTLMLPCVSFNCTAFTWFVRMPCSDEKTRWYMVTLPVGSLFSILIFYPCLAVAYFCELSFLLFLCFVASLETLYVLVLYLAGRHVGSFLEKLGSWLRTRQNACR